MSDPDPFSGIPLSPPLPEINLEDLSGYQIFSLALTDYDHISQPAVRALANIIASKITSLTETEISLLSDDKIGHLIETELSRLSDEEKFSLIRAEISAFFDGVGEAILITVATALADGLANALQGFLDFMEKNPTAFKIFVFSSCIGTGTLGILICYKIKKLIYQIVASSIFQKCLSRLPPLRSVVVIPIQKCLSRLPPLRSVIVPIQRSLPRLSPLRRAVIIPTNTVQGLECIGTSMEADQHQEGTSRALIPNRRSTATYLVKRRLFVS